MIADESLVYDSLVNEALFKMRCCIPCIIQSYDRVKNTVEAQPAIRERVVREDGSVQFVNLPLLTNVPVVFPRTHNYGIAFPLSKNDECLVLFSDLSIDNFWLKGSIQNPVEVRRHDLSDGIAIPCSLSLPKTLQGPTSLTLYDNGRTISFNELYSIIHGHYHSVNVMGAEVNSSTPKGV